ncbi:ARM REPEAT PROTEIN INTERACTING WITH ABF2-like [Heracleum sosnowskyi]|uniref:ARM REPEAT PROTEIN INTERACTING WITH ABF2-like n=1 Tax=Heracleum sosnowskyi TaxID=360622 RepID=A0AAD8MHG5_9APIA|nr:ARM REPEAT PROTEIN INTERACTING WITH ABF2-like [Heracleum sosnowskyi]
MDAITVTKSCLKKILEKEEGANDHSYEFFCKLLEYSDEDVVGCVERQVNILRSSFPSTEINRAAVHNAIEIICRIARVVEYVPLIVQAGCVQALVPHLSAAVQGNEPLLYRHEIARDCALALALVASEPEYRHPIVDAGALQSLVNLLERGKSGQIPEAGIDAVTAAASAIKKLAKDSRIQSRVRSERGIPPLVELLEFPNSKVQRAAAGALRSLSLNNDANKNQIVECNALPALIMLLYSEDAYIHHEAVDVIEILVNTSPENIKKALEAGALQPVIRLLSSRCIESQKEAAVIIAQFVTQSECQVHMVQRGAVEPLIKLVQSQDVVLQELSSFALGMLAQNIHSQAGIAHSGGIVPLLNLLDSNNEVLQLSAAFALYGLSDDKDNVVDIIAAGGVQKLQGREFLLEATINYASETLENLEEKINGHVLSHLLHLMRVADKSVQGRIALALSHLCSPDDKKSIFVDSSGIDFLLELLASPDLKLQRLASEALYNLCPMDTGPPSLISQFNFGEEFFNDPRCSDVTFLIEGKRFYAQRIVLLAASDAFQAIFGGDDYRETEAKDIEISNIRWEVFELMLRYIYVGSVHVSLDVAYDLLKAADKYLLYELKRQCEHTIAQDISVENVSRTYELSLALNASSLRDNCLVFVLEKFNDLVALPGYHDLICRMLPEMRNYFVRAISRSSKLSEACQK